MIIIILIIIILRIIILIIIMIIIIRIIYINIRICIYVNNKCISVCVCPQFYHVYWLSHHF